MQDAVSLIGKSIEVDSETYLISGLHYIPDTEEVHVGLSIGDFTMNMRLDRLIPLLKEQYVRAKN
jgi:hypothetical protein